MQKKELSMPAGLHEETVDVYAVLNKGKYAQNILQVHSWKKIVACRNAI